MELTLDGNSSGGKESRPPRSEGAVSSDPTTKFYSGNVNQFD